MISGRPYDATHPILNEALSSVRNILYTYNIETRPDDTLRLTAILKNLLGSTGKKLKILQPFHCDYGHNISVGEGFFANVRLTILDEAPVVIGDNVFIGPNVSIYTACHPLNPVERNKGTEWSEPVTIGDNVWIGGSVTILPGVNIGDNVTIGAGSVVVHNIPANSVAVGNPAKARLF